MDILQTFSNTLAAVSLLALLCGYFMGSVPFGMFISQFWLKTDIRTIGSGNIGATNVLRSGNKSAAIITLLLDALKGAMPCLVFLAISPEIIATELALLAGIGAIIGHMLPCWLNFAGGKGIATLFGVLFALDPTIGLLIVGVWLLGAALTKYSSVASLLSVIVLMLSSFILSMGLSESFVFVMIAVLVFVRHSGNIQRLMTGEESQISLLVPKNLSQNTVETQSSLAAQSDHPPPKPAEPEEEAELFEDDIPPLPADWQKGQYKETSPPLSKPRDSRS